MICVQAERRQGCAELIVWNLHDRRERIQCPYTTGWKTADGSSDVVRMCCVPPLDHISREAQGKTILHGLVCQRG
jgi:hypothetical protein